MFSSVREVPSNAMTSEYFKLLLCCIKLLALIGSTVAEGEGPHEKMSARHLSMPDPAFHRFLGIDLCSTCWKFGEF